MSQKTATPFSLQQFYDRVARYYAWSSIFESAAKSAAISSLDVSPGQKLLNIGLGTGAEQKVLCNALAPGGMAFGIDISSKMLQEASKIPGGHLCRADARDLPFDTGVFDRLYSAYVLDLVPDTEIPVWLSGFRRVLKPGGKVVLLSLVEGVDLTSRLLVNSWKKLYSLNPLICGGCRPLPLIKWVTEAGFECVHHRIIVQLGLPSELVVAV